MRAVVRILVVCLGFLVLFLVMQRVLTKNEPPPVRMEAEITGRDAEGREVAWRLAIRRLQSVYLNGVEIGEDPSSHIVTPSRALNQFIDKLGALVPPVRIELHNREIESRWAFHRDDQGVATLDGRRCSAEELETRLLDFRKLQEKAPTARLTLDISSRTADDKVAGGTFTIGAGGASCMDGKPSSVEDLLSMVALASGGATVDGRVSDAGQSLVIGEPAEGSTAATRITGRELRQKLAEFIASEDIRRTDPKTVQDVLDLNLPEFTIRKVDLPGFPYRKAYPEATDEPEVVITKYSGHPMLDDPEKMPDTLKEFYPDHLPPVEERLPENPAVLRGLDPKYPIGRYSETTRDTDEEGLMIWRRATADGPVALYRKVGYPALVRFDGAGRLQPHIAWKWEVSPDNRVFTFWLRKGTRWSDGRPFTTADMLFALNTCLLAPGAKNAPLWVQQTDGFSLIYPQDVLDWPGLAARILREAESAEPSPGRQMARIIELDTEKNLAALLEMLRAVTPDNVPDDRTKARIVGKLNSVLSSRLFYDPEAWRGVDLESELSGLLARGYSKLSVDEQRRVHVCLWRNDRLKRVDSTIDGTKWSILDEDQWLAGDVTRFNVVMFRAAYLGLVEPARLRQVKVEAVPDEQGDTSHIIRFTFPEPSSTFLDSLATFMVYLYMCGRQEEYFRKYHPRGVAEMIDWDVLDWSGFVEAMRREAESAGPSPGGHIWPMLSDEIRQRLADEPPSNARDSDDEYKQQVVDELNRLLRRRDFFDAAAWSGVDFDRELDEWYKEGYSNLQTRYQSRVWYLLTRQDYLRRGPADLDEDELLEFNLMALRAAYDGKGTDSDDQLIAENRETALDHQAEYRGYRSYGVLFREVQYYDRKWQPHVPTLCPWRVVSEKGDSQIRAVRNPYYFKVDAKGQQLPYIDLVIDEKAARREIRVLTLRSGQINFQTRNLTFKDFTPLKQAAKERNYDVRLWANDYVGELTFFINQEHADPEYRRIQSDPRFRQALSLALNRQEMINIVWHGMGEPAQFSIPKGSKYYNEHLRTAFIDYDPERANALLDEMGLKERNRDGVRLLPSGRAFHLEVSAEDERPLEAVQLACGYWRDIGINAQMKIRSGMIKWRLVETGKFDVWTHKEGGNYFGPLDAGTIAPQHPASSVHISRWTAWLRSGGREGEEPPDRIKDLDFMWQRVLTAPNERAKLRYWQDLMERTAKEIPVLGIMTSPGKVVLVHNTMRNVPKLALAGWIAHDPGNTNPEVWHVREDE